MRMHDRLMATAAAAALVAGAPLQAAAAASQDGTSLITRLQDNDRNRQARQPQQEQQQRGQAERAAPPKKKKKKGSGIGNCAAGAVVGVLGALLLGGKKKSAGEIVGGAVAGCVVGWGLGKALKGKDEEQLNTYIDDDYMSRDDIGSSQWVAPESGETIEVQTVSESVKTVEHSITYDEDVYFEPSNIQVAVLKMRATAPLRLRSTPDTSTDDNIKAVFDENEIIETYGVTADGGWTYVVDRDWEGKPVLIGYVASNYVSTDLRIPPSTKVAVAKPKPVAKKPATRSTTPTTRPTAVGPAVVQNAPPPRKQVAFKAPTRCKNVQVSAGGRAGGTQERCPGGNFA